MITDVIDEPRLRSAQAFLDNLTAQGARLSLRLRGDPTWEFWVAEIRMPDGVTIHGASGLQQESVVIAVAKQAGWGDPWQGRGGGS